MKEYRCPITIIVDDHVPDNHIDDAILSKIMASGIFDVNIDQEKGIIEGVICTTKLAALKSIEGVSYIRQESTYFANTDDEPTVVVED